MNRSRKTLFSLLIALTAGTMDSLTGLLLWLVPGKTLSLMMIEPPAGQLVYIQFIGAFVLGVGSLYLWAGGRALLAGDWGFLRHVFLGTAWIRLVIFLFGSISIASGGLELTWISVPVTDAAVAILQLAWVRKGGMPDEA